jgi:molybdenum cofactor cytidylyltransferase
MNLSAESPTDKNACATIAGLILAGGASRRMGTPKALLPIAGETFLDRLIRLFVPICDPVMVVLGHNSERLCPSVPFTINPDPERGMLSSLQCGLSELPANSQGVIFTPVDYPSVQSATLVRIAAAFRQRGSDIVIPVYLGRNGHPVCVSRRIAQELLALPVSAQARDVIRQHRDRTSFVDVDDPGVVADIDTPADYQKLLCCS